MQILGNSSCWVLRLDCVVSVGMDLLWKKDIDIWAAAQSSACGGSAAGFAIARRGLQICLEAVEKELYPVWIVLPCWIDYNAFNVILKFHQIHDAFGYKKTSRFQKTCTTDFMKYGKYHSSRIYSPWELNMLCDSSSPSSLLPVQWADWHLQGRGSLGNKFWQMYFNKTLR